MVRRLVVASPAECVEDLAPYDPPEEGLDDAGAPLRRREVHLAVLDGDHVILPNTALLLSRLFDRLPFEVLLGEVADAVAQADCQVLQVLVGNDVARLALWAGTIRLLGCLVRVPGRLGALVDQAVLGLWLAITLVAERRLEFANCSSEVRTFSNLAETNLPHGVPSGPLHP